MFCYKRIDDPDSRIGVIHHGYEFYKKRRFFYLSRLCILTRKLIFISQTKNKNIGDNVTWENIYFFKYYQYDVKMC